MFAVTLFAVAQWNKDFLAVIVFFLMANMPLLLESTPFLSLFFSLGCLLETCFCCVRYWNEYDVTLSSVKDIVGAIWMLVFTIVFASGIPKRGMGQLLLYTSAAINYIAIFSIVTSYNIYMRNNKYPLLK